MTPYTAQIKKQGYLVKEIALIRGVTVGQMSNISKAPTKWDWLALKALGDKAQTGDKYCDECGHLDTMKFIGNEPTDVTTLGRCNMKRKPLMNDSLGWIAICQGSGDKMEEEG